MATSKKVKEEEVKVSPVIAEDNLDAVKEVEKVVLKHEVNREAPLDTDVFIKTTTSETYLAKSEKTEQQKIMDYVANSHSEVVELAPILRSLYPLPTYASPAVYLQQGESKRLMGLLSAMKQDGELSLTNDQYLKLGKSYWVESDTKTRHYNIDTVKIFAIKK